MASPVSRFAVAVAKKSKKPLIGTPAAHRRFASLARHDDAQEAAKWEKISYLGIGVCTVLAAYNLSKGHQHFPDPPEIHLPYPYLHMRNKEFPWGPDGLFEKKKKHSDDHH